MTVPTVDGNDAADLIPIGGRGRASAGGRSSTSRPLTRETLLAERIALVNSTAQ